MILEKFQDNADDLSVGDIVFIKFRVIGPPTETGDVRLEYIPRSGKKEYAARSVNSIFIKRPKSRFMKMIVNKILLRI